jgi:hypothetical protein
MYGHVIALSYEHAFAVEYRARIISPLLYVWGESGPSKAYPHLLGDGSVERFEHLKLNGICFHTVQD